MKNILNNSQVIHLPIQPKPDILKLLLRARQMLSHALEHAGQNSDFDNMIAILGLDSTVEYILRSISFHLDLESITGDSFDIIELSSLAGSINRALQEHAKEQLPYLGEIKLLRQTRNLVQHGAVAPQADLERFSKIVERFFNKILVKIFGFSINELKTSVIIENKLVKNYLQESEDFLDKKEWLKSIIAARNAFENEYFNKIKSTEISIALYPALVRVKEQDDITDYAWYIIKEELELSYLGINTPQHRRFKEYLRHIPKDSGYTIMQRSWNRQDAVFCYNYVANTLLHWQSGEKEKLYKLEFGEQYLFKETIGGISLSDGAEPGCIYFLKENEILNLIYADKERTKRLEKLSKNKFYIYRTIRYKQGKKESDIKEEIMMKGFYKFPIVHEPERWGVIIWYSIKK
ncbi:MAG: hypothetical protein ABSF20_04330 [Smithella sp.]